MNRVKRHFDSVAQNYLARQDRGVWQILRRREMAALNQMLPSAHRLSAIDACSGPGACTALLLSNGSRDVLMVDFSKSMLGAREDEFVSVWMGDFADLKLVTKRDLVICAGGLEFFDAPTSFFASAFLNTRDDGKLLVLYPPWSISGLIYALHHFFNGIRIRLFSKSKIDRHATQSGWKIQARANAHPFATVALYAK